MHAPLRASVSNILMAILCRYITPTKVSQELTRLGVHLSPTDIRRTYCIATLEEVASGGDLLGLACFVSSHLILKEIVEFF